MASSGGPTNRLITNSALVGNVCIGVRRACNGITRKVPSCVCKPACTTGNFMRHFHHHSAIRVGCGSACKACKKLVAVGCIKSAGAANTERGWRCEVHGGQRYKTTLAEVAGLAGACNSYLHEGRSTEYL